MAMGAAAVTPNFVLDGGDQVVATWRMVMFP